MLIVFVIAVYMGVSAHRKGRSGISHAILGAVIYLVVSNLATLVAGLIFGIGPLARDASTVDRDPRVLVLNMVSFLVSFGICLMIIRRWPESKKTNPPVETESTGMVQCPDCGERMTADWGDEWTYCNTCQRAFEVN